MKTKFLFYIIILAAITACEKKLDQVPISQASAGNFYRNTADFEQAVNTTGEDYGSFPLSKGLVFGLNITF